MSDVAGLDWSDVWRRVAVVMQGHVVAGRERLLTEGTLRMSSILSLQAAGVDPGRMVVEVPVTEIGGKVDLARGSPIEVAIEFKYPRDSRTGISPDTMTMGELIRDFLRIAVLADVEGWVVQLVNDRLARYLATASAKYQVQWQPVLGGSVELDDTVLNLLPATARNALGKTEFRFPVVAECRSVERVSDRLTLYAYRVEPALDRDRRRAFAPSAVDSPARVGRGGALPPSSRRFANSPREPATTW